MRMYSREGGTPLRTPILEGVYLDIEKCCKYTTVIGLISEGYAKIPQELLSIE